MTVGSDILNLAYVGVMLGIMVLLAFLWRLLPGLLREEITSTDEPADAPPLPAHQARTRVGPVLR